MQVPDSEHRLSVSFPLPLPANSLILPSFSSSSSPLRKTFAFVKLNGQFTEPLGAFETHQPTVISQKVDEKPARNRHSCFIEAVDGAMVEVGWVDYRRWNEKPKEAFVVRWTVDGQLYALVFLFHEGGEGRIDEFCLDSVNGTTFTQNDPVFLKPKEDPARVKIFEGQACDDVRRFPSFFFPFPFSPSLPSFADFPPLPRLSQRLMKRIRLQLVGFSPDSINAIPVGDASSQLGTIQLSIHRITNFRYDSPE